MVSWSSTTGGQRSTETKYRAEKICLHMVARMLQAGWGRSDKLQQEQTSPNHVQRNFLSSVRPNFLSEIITLARESKGPLPSCSILLDGKNCRRPTLSFSLLLTAGEEGFEWNGQDYPDLLFPFSPSLPLAARYPAWPAPGKNGLDNLGTESERERSVAFKRTVYPSVKTSGYRIVSFRIAASFGCHSVMRIEGRKRRGNAQSQ